MSFQRHTADEGSHECSKHSTRQRLLRSAGDLPVLPTVVAALMSLDRESDDFFDDLLTLVLSEPNFCTRVLSAANSSANAPCEPIGSVRTALTRIGSEGATDQLLALAVMRVFIPRDDWERSLWIHALQVAAAARSLSILAHDREFDSDEAYLSGLLHDVGRFIMFQEVPEELRKIDEEEWKTPESLIETELRVCGITHSELGAAVCHRWNMPDFLIGVVRNHHTPIKNTAKGKTEKLAALVHLADLAMFRSAMPGQIPLHQESDEVINAWISPHVPGFLPIEIEALRGLIKSSIKAAEAICIALGIA